MAETKKGISVDGVADDTKIQAGIDFINNDPYKKEMNDEIPEPEEVEKEFTITQITPLGITTSLDEDANTVCSLSFLCANKAEEKFFTVTHNYIAEEEDQIEKIKENPLYCENTFLSHEIVSNMVLENNPNYITDMNFYYDKDQFVPNKKFYMYGVLNAYDQKNKIYKFYMGVEVFATMALIEDFIIEGLDKMSVSRAIVDGYKHSTMLNTVHMIDNIDKVVALAPAAKDSQELAVVFNVIEGDKSFYVMTTFMPEKKYRDRKFKNMTIDGMTEMFSNDRNLFFNYYMFDAYLKSDDTDYLVVKGRNNQNMVHLFFINFDLQIKLKKLIEAY